MKFIVMHKVDAAMERGDKPSQELISRMGALIGKSLKEGIFLDGAGLHRSAARARITWSGGEPDVERGPYEGRDEQLASMALVTTTGMEQAIELATRLGAAAGQREIEIGPVVEGWDLNGRPRPADAPHRYLLFVKGDAPPAPATRALLDQWKRDGVLQSDTTLKPAPAVRTKPVDGKRRWFDGPFAESKEMIAGFSVLELPSLDDAKRWTDGYVEILGPTTEVDIRVLDQ